MLIQLVRSMIFARLLPPAAFGILCLANVFTQFILLFANFGIGASIVYWKQLDRRDLATCWWGNILIDIAIALLCVVFAFTSSRWTDHPETRWVICLLATQFVLVSFGSVNNALMRRQFMFRRLAIVSVCSALATLLGGLLFIGLLGWEVYGLVGSMVLGTIVSVTLFFFQVPWLPSLTFSWRVLREHINYGRWFLGVSLVTYGNQNIDRALIGTTLTSTDLGYYEYASNLPMQVAIGLSTALSKVLFPAFASIRDDLAKLRQMLLRVIKYNAFIIYPFLTGLALTAPDFVQVAYGETWLPIVWPTRVFCVYGMVRVLTNPIYSLCYGVGKPALPFKWSLIALPLNAAFIWYGVGSGNLAMVAAAKIFLPFFMLVTLVTEITRHVRMSTAQMLRAVLPAFTCCVVMAAVVFSFQQVPFMAGLAALPRLLILVLVGMVSYTAALRVVFQSDFKEAVRLTRRIIPSK